MQTAIVATAVLLATTAGMVTAQDDDNGAPVWLGPIEEDVFSKLGVREGENEPGCKMGEPTDRIALPDDGYEVLGLSFTCEVTYDDARLSGTQTTLWNERCFSAGGCTNWGTQDIVSVKGTWDGWFTGTEHPRGNTNLYIVLTGSGEYEGLTSIRHATGRFWKPLTQTGVVYEGDPPPVARLPLTSTAPPQLPAPWRQRPHQTRYPWRSWGGPQDRD